MCRNTEDAGDVVQETLLAMARSVREFRGDVSMSTWLDTIARRFCIKKRRRSKFAPALEASLEALPPERRERLSGPAPDPEQYARGREIEAAVGTAVDSLDAAQREVLVLRDVERLSAPEVAKVLNISVQAVNCRRHRARLAVRQRVAPALGLPIGAPAPTPRCRDVLMLFSRHLEGEIASNVCAEMEMHLDRCGHCRGACESLKRTLSPCSAIPVPEVPVSVKESVRKAIRRVF
jgi:RNA polymerase sigma-70 factor (ECF subfamily)